MGAEKYFNKTTEKGLKEYKPWQAERNTVPSLE